MRLRVRPDANQEILDTAEYYEAERAGLGGRFSSALQEAIEEIRRHPEMYGIYEGVKTRFEYRRVRVRGFPHIVVY